MQGPTLLTAMERSRKLRTIEPIHLFAGTQTKDCLRCFWKVAWIPRTHQPERRPAENRDVMLRHSCTLFRATLS
jgi:hypothetical protein